MRGHITLDADPVEQVDARVGSRRRSRSIAEPVRSALVDQQRWDALETAVGSIPNEGHAWEWIGPRGCGHNGPRTSAAWADVAAAARQLFDGLEVVLLGRDYGEQAGAWRRTYPERGITLSQSGPLIAAAALGMGGHLTTGNPRDFPMDELEVEHWPVGE